MKHQDPYRISDPDNIFEVCENSSHPELDDSQRVYDYKGHVFKTATELEKFLTSHGVNKDKLKFVAKKERNTDGHFLIRVHVAERIPTPNETFY